MQGSRVPVQLRFKPSPTDGYIAFRPIIDYPSGEASININIGPLLIDGTFQRFQYRVIGFTPTPPSIDVKSLPDGRIQLSGWLLPFNYTVVHYSDVSTNIARSQYYIEILSTGTILGYPEGKFTGHVNEIEMGKWDISFDPKQLFPGGKSGYFQMFDY